MTVLLGYDCLPIHSLTEILKAKYLRRPRTFPERISVLFSSIFL
jgi:hypothetical protein